MEQDKTLPLPVKLTEDEVALRAQELATAEREMGDAEDRLDAYVEKAKGKRKDIEAEIAKHRQEVRDLARCVRERSEEREVPITEVFLGELGIVQTVRVDTGEVVRKRGMTADERQRSLFREVNQSES